MTERLSILVLLVAVGCAPRTTLRPDFASSYQATFDAQADLNRGNLTGPAYALSGEEGLAIRALVAQEASDAESDEVEFATSP